MDFNSKTYQVAKLKEYFKNNGLFLVFHSIRLDSTKWISTEQNLKKLKLNYYKPLNKTAVKAFKGSVYKKFSSNIVGFVLFIDSTCKTAIVNLPSIVKALKSSFTLISIKLNNKVYSISQAKGLSELSYKKNMLKLYGVLNKRLKTSYILTNKKKFSK